MSNDQNEQAIAAGEIAANTMALERLRRLRKELARRSCVPSYFILTTATLEAIAQKRPHHEDELAKIPGIGPAKSATYGAAILRCIRDESASPVELAKDVARQRPLGDWLPRNTFSAWTEADNAALIKGIEEEKSMEELAKQLERTEKGIDAQFKKLGQLTEVDLGHPEEWGTGERNPAWDRGRVLQTDHVTLRKLVARVSQKNSALKLRSPAIGPETPELALLQGADWEIAINAEARIIVEGRATGTKQQRQSAEWWQKAIADREETMMQVATELVLRKQRRFLTEGRTGLVPCTLLEVAKAVGVHETTVSRALAGRSIQTPHGLFALKVFCGTPIKTQNGEATSSEAVKELLGRLLATEDTTDPWSDENLRRMLEERHGIILARRTVAKYREELGIKATNIRKTPRQTEAQRQGDLRAEIAAVFEAHGCHVTWGEAATDFKAEQDGQPTQVRCVHKASRETALGWEPPQNSETVKLLFSEQTPEEGTEEVASEKGIRLIGPEELATLKASGKSIGESKRATEAGNPSNVSPEPNTQ